MSAWIPGVRSIGAFLLVSLCTAERATADDGPLPAPLGATAPTGHLQSAEAALAAWEAKDEAALRALAARDEPDPWLVADALMARGAHDAADAFAKAAPRPDTERLPAYLASKRGVPADPTRREQVERASEALASGMWDRALDELTAAGDGPDADVPGIRTLHGRGMAYQGLGRLQEGAHAFLRAADAAEAIGWLARATWSLQESAACGYYASDYVGAVAAWGRRGRLEERRGNSLGVARVFGNLGLVHEGLGDYAKALDLHEQALALKTRLGDRAGVARTLGDIGTVYYHAGDYAKALDHQERSVRLREEMGDPSELAVALGNLGIVHDALGDRQKALAYYERALRLEMEGGNRARSAMTLGNIGAVHGGLRDYVKALDFHRRALVIKEEVGDRSGAAATLGNIGVIQLALGDTAAALVTLERSVELLDLIADRGGLAIGLTNLAQAHLLSGDHSAALRTARRAVETVSGLGRRLADDQTITLREQFAQVFGIGLEAAARAGDLAQAAWFLEAGRAETLLSWLRGTATLASAVVPPELLAPLDAASGAEVAATDGLRRAIEAGDRQLTRERRAEVDAARDRTREAVERIQRQAPVPAEVLFPRADALETLQSRLASSEALVLYGTAESEAFALVVTAAQANLVSLGSPKSLRDEVTALDLARPQGDYVPAIDALRGRLIGRLQLGKSTTRLLVSPHGAISIVPFGMLFPGEVAYVPSGTALGLLLADGARRGEGVLAVGDPEYSQAPARIATSPLTRAGGLTPLPATREEARAVGDVVLLGPEATEARVAKAVASRQRWRALHFACHALLEAERPAFSCLALTPTGDSDGFLTSLDVFRSRAPADLVVLSACDTAGGRVYATEGTLGLARAFMMAGAPRVLCSLWKVDDEATRALMVRFYALWNPRREPGTLREPGAAPGESKGLGPAAALKAAQEHVRSQEKWKHPYYWAAWVLWGLAQ